MKPRCPTCEIRDAVALFTSIGECDICLTGGVNTFHPARGLAEWHPLATPTGITKLLIQNDIAKLSPEGTKRLIHLYRKGYQLFMGDNFPPGDIDTIGIRSVIVANPNFESHIDDAYQHYQITGLVDQLHPPFKPMPEYVYLLKVL